MPQINSSRSTNSDLESKSSNPSPRHTDDRFSTPRGSASARNANSDTEFSSPRLSSRSVRGNNSDTEFVTPRFAQLSGRSIAEDKFEDDGERYLSSDAKEGGGGWRIIYS